MVTNKMEYILIKCPKCGICVGTNNRAKRARCPRCYTEILIQTSPVQMHCHAVQENNKHKLQPQEQRESPGQQQRNTSLRSMFGLWRSSGNGSPKASATAAVASPSSNMIMPNLRDPIIPMEPKQGKRALICGVSYKKQKYKLKGTIIDAYKMKDFLEYQYGFPEHSIKILAEEEDHPERMPTRKNMEEGLKWLVEGCKPGDSLVFFFSGHGLRQPDFNEDEIDGWDETLCPVDFTTNGMILDNDINIMIVRPLIKGVTLHAIIDACHSGTVLDLEHVYSQKENRWLDNRPPSGARKSTSGGRAICFSACHDDQMAADTSAFSKKGMSGAMTHCFIHAIENNPNLTYYDLLTTMHENITQAYAARCLSTQIMDKLLHRTFLQEPQLSSSEIFDVHRERFEL
ncbi:hypothetical protein Ancab_017491 [Ancistrocladus abbreviatus]